MSKSVRKNSAGVSFDLRKLRLACGITVSDVQRLTGASRTTLYALEAGETVRDTTAIRILKALAKSSRFAVAHTEIDQILRREGATRIITRSATEILDRLDDIVVDVATLVDAPGKVDFPRLEKLVKELTAAVRNLTV